MRGEITVVSSNDQHSLNFREISVTGSDTASQLPVGQADHYWRLGLGQGQAVTAAVTGEGSDGGSGDSLRIFYF